MVYLAPMPQQRRRRAGLRCLWAAAFLLLVPPPPSSVVLVLGQDVRVDRECYPPGQGNFQVTYSGADAAAGDWVTLVPVSSLDHTNNLIANNVVLIDEGDYLAWAWVSQSNSGTVAVPNTLSPGEYVVVLARSADQAPYMGIAASSILTIAMDCTNGPVPVTEASPTASTRTVTDRSAANDTNDQAIRDLDDARFIISGMIANDPDFAPKFLRLMFHDCIGGCDGCVDLTNPENFGLDKPIDALEDVLEQLDAGDGGRTVSRADLWALGATVAVDLFQSSHDRMDFPFVFWGREDCTAHTICGDVNGQPVPCTPKHGPHRQHPSIHLNTADLYHFFASEFGLSAREAIVAMAGGHTTGKLSVPNSGIDGPNGWVRNNQVFDNEYFDELIGGNSPHDPMDVLVNDAPRWRRTHDPPTFQFRNRRIWEGFVQRRRIIMLNADIALFRDLNPSNYDSRNGDALCGFEDQASRRASIPTCPHIDEAVLIGAELKHDNVQFKTEFRDVLEKMLSTGYERVPCDDAVCKLVKR